MRRSSSSADNCSAGALGSLESAAAEIYTQIHIQQCPDMIATCPLADNDSNKALGCLSIACALIDERDRREDPSRWHQCSLDNGSAEPLEYFVSGSLSLAYARDDDERAEEMILPERINHLYVCWTNGIHAVVMH